MINENISISSECFYEYLEWHYINQNIFDKINTLLMETLRTPFYGICKPEPLKFGKDKYWSRRITEEHRLVYDVKEDSIIIISCNGHYLKS
jgi:toxin YoeB